MIRSRPNLYQVFVFERSTNCCLCAWFFFFCQSRSLHSLLPACDCYDEGGDWLGCGGIAERYHRERAGKDVRAGRAACHGRRLPQRRLRTFQGTEYLIRLDFCDQCTYSIVLRTSYIPGALRRPRVRPYGVMCDEYFSDGQTEIGHTVP